MTTKVTVASFRRREYIRLFPKQQLLVVGDFMVDAYVRGTVSRLSPEAPVPVVEVQSESLQMGGAGNVLSNILGLGGTCIPCGVIGNDSAGEWMRQTLTTQGIPGDGMVIEEGRHTTRKTRIIAHRQQMVRYDEETRTAISKKTENRLYDVIEGKMPGTNGLVISDYAKGVITNGLLKRILPLANKAGIPVIVDPKLREITSYRGATLITPNQAEAAMASGIVISDDASLLTAGAILLKKMRPGAVLITRGEKGMALFEPGSTVTHIVAEAREIFDVTGAGDTVVATLALALCAGMPMSDAARLSNVAAGVVVEKVGTAVITKDTLLARL